MCWVAAIPLIAAGIGAATSIYSTNQQKKLAARAQEQAARDSLATPKLQEAKGPDRSTMANAAGITPQPAGEAFTTLLTGPSGVDTGGLSLSRNTLIGANSFLGA